MPPAKQPEYVIDSFWCLHCGHFTLIELDGSGGGKYTLAGCCPTCWRPLFALQELCDEVAAEIDPR